MSFQKVTVHPPSSHLKSPHRSITIMWSGHEISKSCMTMFQTIQNAYLLVAIFNLPELVSVSDC